MLPRTPVEPPIECHGEYEVWGEYEWNGLPIRMIQSFLLGQLERRAQQRTAGKAMNKNCVWVLHAMDGWENGGVHKWQIIYTKSAARQVNKLDAPQGILASQFAVDSEGWVEIKKVEV